MLEKPPPAPPAPPAPAPPRQIARIRRASRVRATAPPPSSIEAPPPPSIEAKEEAPPVVLPGIAFESTTRGGSFPAPAGNTLYGDPGSSGRDPASVKPYKAPRYAPSAQISEMPRTLACDSRILEKYYPEQARRSAFEGDVVLRLLIDSDGSVVKVDLVQDPGEGLGPAALRAIRECRFSAGKVSDEKVATTVPFTLHFTLR